MTFGMRARGHFFRKWVKYLALGFSDAYYILAFGYLHCVSFQLKNEMNPEDAERQWEIERGAILE